MKHSVSPNPLHYWTSTPGPLQLPRTRPHRYVTFDIDQGGLNNIRLVFEYVVVVAAITGRTLVLPPARPWYLINFGPIHTGEEGGTTHLGDIFDLAALRQAIPVLTAEEFIAEAAEHLQIPARFQTDTPEGLSGELLDQWRDWLFGNCELTGWNPYDTLICTPDIASVKEHTDDSGQLDEIYVDGRELVEFSPRMNAAPTLHFPSNETHRSLGPVATMLAAADSQLPAMTRRLLRQGVRFRTEIFDLAFQLLDGLGYRQYNAMHVRRNDFQYEQTQLNAESIIRNTAPLFDARLPLYIATDETSEEFRDFLAKVRNVVYWEDLLKTAGLTTDIPPAWVGPIEQLVCAGAREFAGTDLSTFTTYIHRMRGYLLGADANTYYHTVNYMAGDTGPGDANFRGRNYLQENPLFWLDC